MPWSDCPAPTSPDFLGTPLHNHRQHHYLTHKPCSHASTFSCYRVLTSKLVGGLLIFYRFCKTSALSYWRICQLLQTYLKTADSDILEVILGGPVYSIISSWAQFWRFSVAVCYIGLVVGGLLVENRSADLSVAIEESVNFCTLA